MGGRTRFAHNRMAPRATKYSRAQGLGGGERAEAGLCPGARTTGGPERLHHEGVLCIVRPLVRGRGE